MTQVVLALGSNVGDALGYLQEASEALSSGLDKARASSVYRTAPMYVEDQPSFLNAAVVGETERGPLPLLQWVKSLERRIGRSGGLRFGPREIDIDLIAYGCAAYRFCEEGRRVLEAPHPRIAERRFVLAPVSELLPEGTLPGLGRVQDLLEKTNDQRGDVVKLNDAVLPIHSPG